MGAQGKLTCEFRVKHLPLDATLEITWEKLDFHIFYYN